MQEVVGKIKKKGWLVKKVRKRKKKQKGQNWSSVPSDRHKHTLNCMTFHIVGCYVCTLH